MIHLSEGIAVAYEPAIDQRMLDYEASINAAGALATLAAKHAENRQVITKRLVSVLGTKCPPERAVRVLR